MEVNEKSLVKKPKDKKEKDVEKNPIQSFQEKAFLQIMLSNDRLKRGQDDTVCPSSTRKFFNNST